MQHLMRNMRALCDEMRMLTGLCVVCGTSRESESALCGRAQEVTLEHGQFVPCVRPLEENSIYDLASLTKLFTSVMTMILVERGLLRLDEHVGEIDARFSNLTGMNVFDTLCFRVCLQTPGRIDDAPDREEGLRRLFGVTFRVNSTHHQAVRDLGEGLRATALSPEGIIEAYEHETLPILATQFHPERLCGDNGKGVTPDFLPLFEHFVALCRENAKQRM